jgi:hypothetical protein
MDGLVQYANGQSNTTTLQDTLDVRVLGVCSGSGLNQLNFAFVRYRQDSPNAALRLELLRVRATGTAIPALLMKNSTARCLLPSKIETISLQPFARSSASLRQ